jgi:hypothetical protein
MWHRRPSVQSIRLSWDSPITETFAQEEPESVDRPAPESEVEEDAKPDS